MGFIFISATQPQTGRIAHPGARSITLDLNSPPYGSSHGTIFDIDPSSPKVANIRLADIHTHPWKRRPDRGDFAFQPFALIQTSNEQRSSFAITMTPCGGHFKDQQRTLGQLRDQHPWIVPVAWVNPNTTPSRLKTLESLLRDHDFRGIKLHPPRDGYCIGDSELQPALDDLMALAGTYHVPMMIHSNVEQTQDIAKLAKKHKRVNVIVLNNRLGETSRAQTLRWFVNTPNLYAETSWCDAYGITKAMQCLDSSRVLRGTDATTDEYDHFRRHSVRNGLSGNYQTIPEVDQEVRSSVDPEAYKNWAWRNAVRLFGLRSQDIRDITELSSDE